MIHFASLEKCFFRVCIPRLPFCIYDRHLRALELVWKNMGAGLNLHYWAFRFSLPPWHITQTV